MDWGKILMFVIGIGAFEVVIVGLAFLCDWFVNGRDIEKEIM